MVNIVLAPPNDIRYVAEKSSGFTFYIFGSRTCLCEAAFSLRSHFGEVGQPEAGEMPVLPT